MNETTSPYHAISIDWTSLFYPQVGSIWTYRNREVVVCGNGETNEGSFWVADWQTGQSLHVCTWELYFRWDCLRLSQAELMERFNLWAFNGNADAMWFLGWWNEGKNHERSVWFFVGAVRANPKSYYWLQSRLWSEARRPSMHSGYPAPDLSAISRIPEVRSNHVGTDWQSAVRSAQQAPDHPIGFRPPCESLTSRGPDLAANWIQLRDNLGYELRNGISLNEVLSFPDKWVRSVWADVAIRKIERACFTRKGPRGAILIGSPGAGKTALMGRFTAHRMGKNQGPHLGPHLRISAVRMRPSDVLATILFAMGFKFPEETVTHASSLMRLTVNALRIARVRLIHIEDCDHWRHSARVACALRMLEGLGTQAKVAIVLSGTEMLRSIEQHAITPWFTWVELQPMDFDADCPDFLRRWERALPRNCKSDLTSAKVSRKIYEAGGGTPGGMSEVILAAVEKVRKSKRKHIDPDDIVRRLTVADWVDEDQPKAASAVCGDDEVIEPFPIDFPETPSSGEAEYRRAMESEP